MTSYVSVARGSAGILAEPQEVTRLQNTDCSHTLEGLQHFPTGRCFSNSPKCKTHANAMPWSCCSCVLGALLPAKLAAGSYPASSLV